MYVYKSDLIALDDSWVNIRTLTAKAQTFIAFGVDVTVAGSVARYWGMTEFRRDPRDVSYLSRITTVNLTAKRGKTIATPRDLVFSREFPRKPEPIDFFFPPNFRRSIRACRECTYTRVASYLGR